MDVLVMVSIAIGSYVLVRLLRLIIKKNFKRYSEDDERKTSLRFLNNMVAFVIYLAATIVIFSYIPALRKLGLSLFAGAGILAAIIGFASQNAIANIIGGIFVVVFKPFRVGDFITVSEKSSGTVEDITLRHTVIRNVENKRIIIPNAIINSENILNSSIIDDKICNLIEVGIAYDASIDKARAVIQEEARKHPFYIDNRGEFEIKANESDVMVRVISLADFSVVLRAYVWTEDIERGFGLKYDLYESIKKAFDREGIEIPFPYRTLVYKNDLPKNKNEVTSSQK